ncbi:MAG: LysR family transcriptional regulator [Anaerotignum sp.]|nr:LysR family transcriptional regulator [Anaerotignum sp.]MBR3992684.1 LysR family transcriptional regulator [Anaerotignum sp.]
MDIKNLVTFINVAELRSFTKAGDKLGYSQSTVSFQIRQLENELGVPLFERINRTVTLTEHGSRLLQSAYKINDLLQGFLDDTEAAAEIRGVVRLVMADSLCNEVIGRIFPELHRAYPGITLECVAAGTQEMFRMLNQNEADLVYTLDSHIYDTNYINLQEGRIGVHFVCAANHPLADRPSVSLKELIQQPFLLTEKGMSYRRVMDEALAAKSLEIRPVFVSGNTDLIRNLVAQGAGISFLPDYTTKELIAAGKLKYLQVPEMKVEIWTQLLHHRDKWISEPMRIVIDYLHKCIL